MREFTDLYYRLDGTTKTLEKIAALKEFFNTVSDGDAAWALYFLSGNRLSRVVNTRLLREAVSESSGLPIWLVEECYDVVGDLAETVALLHPDNPQGSQQQRSLQSWIEADLKPLKGIEDEAKKDRLKHLWMGLNRNERFVWNKLITGGFRVGVSRGLVARALAERLDLTPAVMAHRLMGDWEPSAAFWQTLHQTDAQDDPGKPYPFYLASPLEQAPDALGIVADWQIEWKWDGIRAQLIRRSGTGLLWSRGEELISDRFPEPMQAAGALPDGTVLDGELLAWREGAPMPFLSLQRRIGRKRVGKKLLADIPVIFMAYDIMEFEGEDIRDLPQEERRKRLAAVVESLASPQVQLSPIVSAESWEGMAAVREESRRRGVEGLMVKRKTAPYRAGRTRGDWWKWKVAPYEVDAVLTYAQKGHGRRAGLFTDYTFGLWKDGELVTFAKAYSGLTDKEFREVDRFVKANTLERFGPVRRVKPELVFQIACEGIQRSDRHKSGVAVRFPRMVRWRRDKAPEDADHLEDICRWLPE